MTPLTPLTAPERITYVAEDIMGWDSGTYEEADGTWHDLAFFPPDSRPVFDWNPLTDHNHWRQVELEMMETGWRASLRSHFLEQFENIAEYIEADLPTKVARLISAHQSLYAN